MPNGVIKYLEISASKQFEVSRYLKFEYFIDLLCLVSTYDISKLLRVLVRLELEGLDRYLIF